MRIIAAGSLFIACIATGCVASVATRSAAPSTTVATTPSPSEPAPTTAAVAASPTDRPSASTFPSFPPDDVFLPPNARVSVSVDILNVRAEPTTTGQIVATLGATDELLIVAGFDSWGPVVHGDIPWYPVQTLDRVYGWAAGEQAGTRFLEAKPITCAGHADSAEILAMTAWERLVCFGDSAVTLTGVTEVACMGGVRPNAVYEPLWLANWCPPFALTDRESVAAQPTSRMVLAFPPELGIGVDHGSLVEVTGHFDDAAAADCNVRPSLDEDWFQPAVQVLCREQFVVTSVRVNGHLEIPSPG